VPIVLAGEPVEAVAAERLVRIFHRDVLVAEHVQRRKPDTGQQQAVRLRQGSRRSRRATDGMVVTRVVDSLGVCLVRRHPLSGRQPLAGLQRPSLHRGRFGPAVLRRPDRPGAPDPARPGQGAWRVRHPERAAPPPPGCPAGAGVKAPPLRGRPAGRALTATP
jgi:hypothetical protein